MEIYIQSAEHFNKLLNALAGDIIDGELYFKLGDVPIEARI